MNKLPDDYQPPKTAKEALDLLWQVTYPAELAKMLSERPATAQNPNPKVSRAALSKWKTVPIHRIPDIVELTGIPREHLAPEVYGHGPGEQPHAPPGP